MSIAANQAFARQDYAKCLQLSNLIISRAPDSKDIYFLRGCAYMQMEEYAEAAKNFDQCLKLGGKMPDYGYEYRSQCYAEVGQWQKALESIDKSIALKPLGHRYDRKGEIYVQLGKTPEAIASFKKSLEVEPKSYWSSRKLVSCYTSANMYKEALEECNRLIKLKPDEPFSYAVRAKVYDKLGKHDLAKKDMEQANKKADFSY